VHTWQISFTQQTPQYNTSITLTVSCDRGLIAINIVQNTFWLPLDHTIDPAVNRWPSTAEAWGNPCGTDDRQNGIGAELLLQQ
jgi:hypothetical protein